jgi:hypothetical protein
MESVMAIRAQRYGVALCAKFHLGYSSKVHNSSSRCTFTDLCVSAEDDFMKVREVLQDDFFAEYVEFAIE